MKKVILGAAIAALFASGSAFAYESGGTHEFKATFNNPVLLGCDVTSVSGKEGATNYAESKTVELDLTVDTGRPANVTFGSSINTVLDGNTSNGSVDWTMNINGEGDQVMNTSPISYANVNGGALNADIVATAKSGLKIFDKLESTNMVTIGCTAI